MRRKSIAEVGLKSILPIGAVSFFVNTSEEWQMSLGVIMGWYKTVATSFYDENFSQFPRKNISFPRNIQLLWINWSERRWKDY
jgi:hypothetical protein